jgi:hypothetical protein
MFECYGGKKNKHKGAEYWAADFLQRAREAFLEDDKKVAESLFGYAIHYIQDAACIPHVFPFNEGITGIDAHGGFEGYAEKKYKNNQYWRGKVAKAKIIKIVDTTDLKKKVKSIAHEVFKFPVEFLAEDGNYYKYENGKIKYRSPWVKLPWEKDPWIIDDEYIIKAMEMAAGVVKGAAIWVFSKKSPSKSIWQGISENISNFFKKKSEEGEKKIKEELENAIREMEKGIERETRRCCVGEATYGSSSELDILREFRNKILLKNKLGRKITDFYYSIFSPIMVDFVSKYPIAKLIIKEIFIKPIIKIVEVSKIIGKQSKISKKKEEIMANYLKCSSDIKKEQKLGLKWRTKIEIAKLGIQELRAHSALTNSLNYKIL